MLETKDILETINMIDNEDLDVRTITMGISLLDCMDNDIDKACQKVYDKVCYSAKDLVKTGMDIESEYGIPIINKRVSVTPIGMVAAPCKNQDITKLLKHLIRLLIHLVLTLSVVTQHLYKKVLHQVIWN